MKSIHASLGILFSVGGLLVCQENPQKPRPPDIGRQLEVEIQLDLDFGKNPPKTTEEKVKRAQNFLEEASRDSKEPDYRYVLYRRGMLYFAEAGSVEMALKAKKGIEAYDVNELELKHHDLLWGWPIEIARAAYFFHPVVHWVCFRLRLERELACDQLAMVLGGRGPDDSIKTLLDGVSPRGGLAPLQAAISAGLEGQATASFKGASTRIESH